MKNELFSLAGKVVVITGSAGLLGRQHAEAVASAGGIPVLLDIRAEAVQELADEISSGFDVPASGWAVDITNEPEIEDNCAAVLARYGHIDALVNNAANNPKVEGDSAKAFAAGELFSGNLERGLGRGAYGRFPVRQALRRCYCPQP